MVAAATSSLTLYAKVHNVPCPPETEPWPWYDQLRGPCESRTAAERPMLITSAGVTWEQRGHFCIGFFGAVLTMVICPIFLLLKPAMRTRARSVWLALFAVAGISLSVGYPIYNILKRTLFRAGMGEFFAYESYFVNLFDTVEGQMAGWIVVALFWIILLSVWGKTRKNSKTLRTGSGREIKKAVGLRAISRTSAKAVIWTAIVAIILSLSTFTVAYVRVVATKDSLCDASGCPSTFCEELAACVSKGVTAKISTATVGGRCGTTTGTNTAVTTTNTAATTTNTATTTTNTATTTTNTATTATATGTATMAATATVTAT